MLGRFGIPGSNSGSKLWHAVIMTCVADLVTCVHDLYCMPFWLKSLIDPLYYTAHNFWSSGRGVLKSDYLAVRARGSEAWQANSSFRGRKVVVDLCQ